MSFRARIATAAAAAVALAVVLASILVFFAVRGELRTQIDESLDQRWEQILDGPGLAEVPSQSGNSFLAVPRGLDEPTTFVQLIRSDGKVLRQRDESFNLPVSEQVLTLSQTIRPTRPYYYDTNVDGTHVRVLTLAYGPGYALQIARPLTEVDSALAQIRLYLLIVALVGIGLAAVLGLVVSRAALSPVQRLTNAAERVTETGDLSERIEVAGGDELSRLAGSFNTMLAALEESTRAQRQLVADASHELRTPLTSLRTNIEVLADNRELPEGERSKLISDVVEQLGEMTTLIAELIELAHAEQQNVEAEDVRLDLLTADAIERARRNQPGVRFSADLEESVVRGVPATLERAIGNLLDNAAKWSPPGAEVEVEARDGFVTVRDHGPGIAEEDLPYVFDRFYRARAARGMPGSGLGLAIVRQIAEAHGGEVAVECAAGGGTRMTLRLNGARAVDATDRAENAPARVLPSS